MPMGTRSKLDVEGDYNSIPEMGETDQIKMLDNFYPTIFNEDSANLRKMQSAVPGKALFLLTIDQHQLSHDQRTINLKYIFTYSSL